MGDHSDDAKFGLAERASWGDFQPVIRNGDLGSLKNEPEYEYAKSGNVDAAIDLVFRLMTDGFLESLSNRISDQTPVLLPVLAEEGAGRNKIPLAMAIVLSKKMGWEISTYIYQKERIGRTDSGADHRLAFNPTFRGPVLRDRAYIILDDTLTMGGTLASLRGFIVNRGGKAAAGAVMTAHEGALDLAVKPKMLQDICRKHGSEMDQFWRSFFGYGIDQLTQGEAGHLKGAETVDAIRRRIVTARYEGFRRLYGQKDHTLDRGRAATVSESRESTLIP